MNTETGPPAEQSRSRHGEAPRRVPRLWPFLLICAGCALWIDLGTLHRLQHADSLIPVLVSLQRWTPFFWEQDRYGMLIPWLARPVTDPFGNLLLQGFLNVWCGLSAFFLLARYMLREPSYPIVAAVGATAFLALAPAPYRFDFLMDANYGVWLTLGLGGLIVAEPGPGPRQGVRAWCRRLVALGLIVLAHWVYLATALYLGMLVASRALLAPGFVPYAARRLRDCLGTKTERAGIGAELARSGPVEALLMLLAGLLTGVRLADLARHHTTSFTSLSPEQWPDAWARLVGRTWRALAPGAWPLALGAAAGLVAIVCLLRGRNGRSAIPGRAIAALIASAIVVALFMGTRRWLLLNAYVPRYLLPSVFLVQGALTMLIVVPLCRGARSLGLRGPPPAVATLVLLLPGVVSGYGLPSPTRVRAGLDRFGALTPDLLAVGCTHLAGDFWTVWPAVFHANLTLRERGESRTIWGVTFRGQPASVIWWYSPRSRRVACIPLDDPYGDNWLLAFGFARFREVGRTSTVRVLRWRPDLVEGE